MEITTLLLLIITMAFIMALGVFGIYWIYGGQTKKRLPKTIDLEFFKKYNSKEEKEVEDRDREKVWRYASTGWMQTGLSESSKLTARLTERGRRLIK